jgi:dihydrofolate synthase/folylpolyglutamate synthase
MAERSFGEWLAYIEAIHAKPMDFGLERVSAVARRLGIGFDCPVITVGGTNGKGSTCAMLESILIQAGYRVCLHTSPHLLRFNERARIDGQDASDAALAESFVAVEAARAGPGAEPVSLTYFEFTLLAILRLFMQAKPDAVILEVGLGGRLDAVNMLDADCSIVTSIDLDHMEYLGDTREAIGLEKAHIYRPGRPAICADPVPPQSLLDHAAAIGADLWLFGRDFNYSGDKQQWSYGGRRTRRNAMAYPALRGANQLLNASAALAALESLGDRLPVSQGAVRQGFALVDIPGRFQVLPGRPAVILDVAHNPHAAAVLARNLDSMGFFPYTHAVFGALQDKDIGGVLGHLRDKIDHWHLCTLGGPRGASAETLHAELIAQGFKPQEEGAERSVRLYESAQAAYQSARAAAGEGDRIVVFGSFLTVAGVMQLQAQR